LRLSSSRPLIRTTSGSTSINLSLGHPPYEAAATDPLVQPWKPHRAPELSWWPRPATSAVNPQTNQVGYGGILSPANAPSAFAVASAKTQGTLTPDDDLIANYSSRGPTWIDGFAKPDFAAPGQNLVAPAAPGSFLATTYPSLLVNDSYGGQRYIALSVTSMAAGVESGLVAVVLEASRAKTALLGSAGLRRQLSHNALKAFTEVTRRLPCTTRRARCMTA